jgi:hypothetical protein
MRKHLSVNFAAALTLAVGTIATHGQSSGSYDLKWNTIAGGGGACAGGAFALSGTVGQPDAGVVNGTSFSLAGGFWPGMQDTQPSLRIERYGGFVVLAWPSSFTGFSLQESADLGSRNWSTVARAPVEIEGENMVIQPATASARFYRLSKP